MSACFNFGIEAGKPMAEQAVAEGWNPLFQNNVTYVVIVVGWVNNEFHLVHHPQHQKPFFQRLR
jgi:L-rhamnose-H+ transport protein